MSLTRERERERAEKTEVLVLLMNVPTLAGNCHASLFGCQPAWPGLAWPDLSRCPSGCLSVAPKGSTNCRPFRMLYEQSVHLPVRKCSQPSCDAAPSSRRAGTAVGGEGIIQYILQACEHPIWQHVAALASDLMNTGKQQTCAMANSLLKLQNSIWCPLSSINHTHRLPLACAKLILISGCNFSLYYYY